MRTDRWIGLFVTVAATVAVAALPVSATADAPPYGTQSDDTPAPCPAGTPGCPSADPFYAAPANLASLPDGSIVGVRPATIAQPGPSPRAAYTISYRSQDAFGAPVLDTATVFLPSSSYTGAGTQPLVSLQFPIDSLGAQCAPSYALAHPNTNQNVDAAKSELSELLAQGYVVVAPDFDGPAEQFIATQQEGHAVLDGIRAAESLPAAGLSRATRVAIEGYSGGSHGTASAAELAASYAPDLHIVAAAEGGTPADLSATAKYLNGTAFFGLVMLSSEGMARAFPGAGLYGDLNAAGKAAFAALADQCVNATTSYAGQNLDEYTTQPDLIDSPTFQALLAHEKLGQSPPRFPVFSYHVYNDEIVPFSQDQTYVDTMCAAGTPVDFVALGGDHLSGEAEGSPLVQAYLQGIFNGSPAPNNCAAVSGTPGLPQVPALTLGGSGGSGGSGAGAGSGSGGGVTAPTVTTGRAVHVHARTAVVLGTVATHGTRTYIQFQYVAGRGRLSRGTPLAQIAAGASGVRAVRATLPALRPRTNYRFRLVAFYTTASGTLAEVTGRTLRLRTSATGRLAVRRALLTVRHGTVAVPLRCLSAARCVGILALRITARAGARGHARLLCATDRGHAFSVRAHRRRTVRLRLRTACLTLLGRASGHRLTARLTAALPRNGQAPLSRRVALVLG